MLALLSIAALAITADPAAEVRLRSTATCTSSIVRLADVADIVSSDSHLAQALAEVPLCPAPAAGSERSLNQQAVRELLATSGVERNCCRLTGSESVTLMHGPAMIATHGRFPVVASGVRQALFMPEAPAKQSLPSKSTTPSAPRAVHEKPATAAVLVERGSVVSVVAKAAGVRITSSGKALAAGSEGEAVHVELADTKQRILAYVTGPQAVEIKSPGVQ